MEIIDTSNNRIMVQHTTPAASIKGMSTGRRTIGASWVEEDEDEEAIDNNSDVRSTDGTISTTTSTITTSMMMDGKPSTPKKHVIFSTIEVREYGMTMGDNPCVSSGVPVTIDWTPQLSMNFNLDQFENSKPEARDMRFMRIGSGKRELIASNDGYTQQEILNVIEEMKSIQLSRRELAKSFTDEEVPPTKPRFSFRTMFSRGNHHSRHNKYHNHHHHHHHHQNNNAVLVKFGHALQPEDYAMLNLPDMTKLPIGVCCDGLKELPQRKTSSSSFITNQRDDNSTYCDSTSSRRSSGSRNSQRSRRSTGSRRRGSGDRRFSAAAAATEDDSSTIHSSAELLNPSDPEFFAGRILLL